MRVLVAGATGLIGRAMLPLLSARGHHVTAMVRVSPGLDWSASVHQVVVADALDPAATRAAVSAAAPEVVVHQMTALRTRGGRLPEDALARTASLRTEGTANLLDAARAAGARRVVAQSIAFATAPADPPDAEALLDEDAPLYVDAPDEGWATTVRAVAELERLVVGDPALPGAVLRYGTLHGPGTRYDPTGPVASALLAGRMPVPGAGAGVTSFVSVEDAASAAVAAVEGAVTGVLNIVDDDPVPAGIWLPEYARRLGAPPPRVVGVELAERLLGWFVAYQLTRLAGASNARARARLGWQPAHTWRTDLAGRAEVPVGEPGAVR